MKIKLSGSALQVKVVLALETPTLNGRSSYNVPDPASGTKFVEKAESRKVLSVPGPVLRMFAETFQFGSLVSPAL